MAQLLYHAGPVFSNKLRIRKVLMKVSCEIGVSAAKPFDTFNYMASSVSKRPY